MIDGRTAVEAAGCALVAAIVAVPVMRTAIGSAPSLLVRTNVDGERVPAVLGIPVAGGGVAATIALGIAVAAGWTEVATGRMTLAVALLVVAMFAAGLWDDSRGDERPRGFKGHLAALKQGRVTGGLVKLLAGGVAGLLAGLVVTSDLPSVIEIGAVVALSANLVNLMDRAPGRAGKIALLAAVPLVILGSGPWTVAAMGTVVALTAVLPADLQARAMLGDAGANPIGAVIGLGLAVSLDERPRLVTIGVLVLLNLASEKWSFSRFIAANRPLRAFDMWGRERPGENTRGDHPG